MFVMVREEGADHHSTIAFGEPMTTCIGPICVKPITYPKFQLCEAHYKQQHLNGALKPLRVSKQIPEHKFCPTCKEHKPLDRYGRNKTTHDGYQSKCRDCQRAEVLKSRYGMTIEEYDTLLASQDGRCKICRRTPQDINPDNPKNLSVDHDHNHCATRGRCCGKCIRGLLCQRCNMTLGYADDDPSLLMEMAAYLAVPRSLK